MYKNKAVMPAEGSALIEPILTILQAAAEKYSRKLSAEPVKEAPPPATGDRLLDLLQAAASNLTGKSVRVRLQAPVRESALGQAYKTEDGGAVLDLAPFLNLDELFDTFLHETAHIFRDFSEMDPAAVYRMDPGSVTRSESERAELRALPRESAADRQAAEWRTWAQTAGRVYARSDRTNFETWLIALARK